MVDALMKPMLAYVGPDTILPLASILAVMSGFFLMFWRGIVRWIGRALGLKKKDDAKQPQQAGDVDGRT